MDKIFDITKWNIRTPIFSRWCWLWLWVFPVQRIQTSEGLLKYKCVRGKFYILDWVSK
jgi:hypothetical protein